MNITLIGFMGTGKTTVGKRLAQRLGWAFVDLDAEIEARTGRSVADIFAQHGEPVFRRLEQRWVRRVARGEGQVIATGGGAFLDPENRRLLKSGGPVICLTASPAVILQRVKPALSKRPLLAGAPPLARIQQLLAQRAASYDKADWTIDTTRLSPEQVAEQVWEPISPWLCKSWHYLLQRHDHLIKRYGGRYVAVFDDRVVAVGATQLEAYQRIRPPVPAGREVGIYYISSSADPAVVL
ncbi:MAG: shikimate kinase [Candidatus Omnitrophica bacterium]|nr:shikimate kinase [Candidatus Omnitrophota bacterium]